MLRSARILLWAMTIVSGSAFPTPRCGADQPTAASDTSSDASSVVDLFEFLIANDGADPDTAKKCLAVLADKIQNRELSAAQIEKLRPRLDAILNKILAGKPDAPLYVDSALLAASWRNSAAIDAVRKMFESAGESDARRLQALGALVSAGDRSALDAVRRVLADRTTSSSTLRSAALASLGRLDDPKVAEVVLAVYARLDADLQPKAVELLTQRAAWTRPLLDAIGKNQIPAAALNANQVRKLLASKDVDLAKAVRAKWGNIRTERDPARELVIAQMRQFIHRNPGDAHKGQAVFNRICGQCHKLYGEGADVGPDITVNGRSSFDQLLSNVFDPSLVIGASYQAVAVRTTDGRALAGLVVEDNDQRVVLKVQGGKQETIPRDEIDEMRTSKLSLMPEELEKQIKPNEMADLFALLTLDRPPGDPTAKQLPGVRWPLARSTSEPSQFTDIVGEVAPGFGTSASGEGGVALLAEHNGRTSVVRTHPVDRTTPCVLRGAFDIPKNKKTRLAIDVSHHAQGDWRLVVRANGKTLHDSLVGDKNNDKDGANEKAARNKDGAAKNRWTAIAIDLSSFAGQRVDLTLENRANDWNNEFAYWGRVSIGEE